MTDQQQQQQPQMTDEEREYRRWLTNEVAAGVLRDINVAKQVAMKAFGNDVKPEVTLLVYDRIFERASEMLAAGNEEPGDEG